MFNDPQFWVFIAFVIFIVAIFNPVRKILTKSLDDQIREIKKSIEQAEQLKNDAQITQTPSKNQSKNETNIRNENNMEINNKHEFSEG